MANRWHTQRAIVFRSVLGRSDHLRVLPVLEDLKENQVGQNNGH